MAKQIYSLLFIFLLLGNSFCFKDVPSLHEHFDKYFKIGTSVSPGELGYAQDFIKHHFDSITPENELKPDAILDQNASKQYGGNVNPQVRLNDNTKATLRFCQDNGIPLRGHTFVWHSQTPDWLFKENFESWGNDVPKDIMNQRLENMIKNVFAAIKNEFPNLQLYAYDVANEVFLNDGGGLRPRGQSRWMDIYGNDEFIVNAFSYARKYAPQGCKLYINDYNEYIPAKTNDIYNIAMKLKGMGIIDGIGMQSHLSTDYPSADVYRTGLEKFCSTGLDVMITELDITCQDFGAQAGLYQQVFQAAVNHANQVKSLTVWGTTDERSWRSSGKPLLFSNYQPKEAYYRVMTVGKKEKFLSKIL